MFTKTTHSKNKFFKLLEMLLFTNDPTKLLTFLQRDFHTIAITYHANKKADFHRDSLFSALRKPRT